MTKQITEEMEIHKEWYEEARKQTLKTLPAFMKKLANNYEHDYGTICHALAASAIGAAWAMNDSPQGGITGFQGGAVMWEFIRHWQGEKGAMKLVKYDDMLYPQNHAHFDKTIPQDIFDDLKKKAIKNLVDDHKFAASPKVREHWVKISEGIIPFGYEVTND